MSPVKVHSHLTSRRPVRARRVTVGDAPALVRRDWVTSIAFTVATGMIPVAVGALVVAAVVVS